MKLKKYTNYIPSFYYDSVFEIPFEDLLHKNIKALFFDLDNTLIEPYQKTLNYKIYNLLINIIKKFQIIIISKWSTKSPKY
ncbi:MAG: YqeG family HAD IIIA-type phosphatase, partial [Candidatus Phytoplasma australasiaticum]|nr:YqeG family HAD IIIA-type phosphatase [Candidatus Phytoplasma australasiaticum]